jgi:acetylornithine deacetylase/succinyl-diaminopimelate desuccinylase-like protein
MHRIFALAQVLAALAPGAGLAVAQDPLEAVRRHRDFNQGAILAQLRELLSIPNVAGDLPNIRRNAELLVSLLRQRGAQARLIETGGEPLVYGEIGDPGRPAILFYCHYDGQPVEAANWAQENPWVPILRTATLEAGGRIVERWPGRTDRVDPEWRIYARSASDDKAPIVALLAILDAWREAGVTPPNRLKFLFEGDEEAGSRYLADAAQRHRELLAADLAVMADGPIHPSGRPSAFFGLRGLVTVDLTVYGPIRPLHSGHYGNWAPNPAMRLAQLLASLKDAQGEVLVAGWEDDVIPLGPAELRALERFPHDDEAQRLQFQLGSVDGKGRTRHELIARPSLNVRGLRSLFVGAGARTLIPSEAVASLDVRLVAGNTPQRQVEKLVRHIEAQGYTVVREDPDSVLRVNTPRLVKVEVGSGYPAGRTPLDHPAAVAVVRALENVGLGEPVVVPTMGGSGPAYVFTDILGQPFVIVPIVNHDNNQHAENENLRVGNLFRGMEILAAVASAPLPSR